MQQALFFSFLKKTKAIKQKKLMNIKSLFSNDANKNEAINIFGCKSI